MSNIKNTVKKLGKFVENKREQAIVNITNATGTGILIKWLITNKLSVLLFLVVVFGGGYYKFQLHYLQEQIDRVRIGELEDDLVLEKTKTLELLKKIEKLAQSKKEAKKINDSIRKQINGLSAKQKKRLLLEYRDRLMKKRGK